MIEFPSFVAIDRAAYAISIDGANIETKETVGGMPRMRLIRPLSPVVFSITVTCPRAINDWNEAYRAFWDWIKSVAKGGSEKFLAPLNVGNGIEQIEVCINPESINTTRNGNEWRMTMEFIAESIPTVAGAYDAAQLAAGGEAGDFPAWVKPSPMRGYSFDGLGSLVTGNQVDGSLYQVQQDLENNSMTFSLSTNPQSLKNGGELAGFLDWFYNHSRQGTKKFELDLDSGAGTMPHKCCIVAGSLSITSVLPLVLSFDVVAERVFAPEDGALYDSVLASGNSPWNPPPIPPSSPDNWGALERFGGGSYNKAYDAKIYADEIMISVDKYFIGSDDGGSNFEQLPISTSFTSEDGGAVGRTDGGTWLARSGGRLEASSAGVISTYTSLGGNSRRPWGRATKGGRFVCSLFHSWQIGGYDGLLEWHQLPENTRNNYGDSFARAPRLHIALCDDGSGICSEAGIDLAQPQPPQWSSTGFDGATPTNLPYGLDSGATTEPMSAMCSNGNTVIAAFGKYISMSTDSGRPSTWAPLPERFGIFDSSEICSMDISPDGTYIIALCSDGEAAYALMSDLSAWTRLPRYLNSGSDSGEGGIVSCYNDFKALVVYANGYMAMSQRVNSA